MFFDWVVITSIWPPPRHNNTNEDVVRHLFLFILHARRLKKPYLGRIVFVTLSLSLSLSSLSRDTPIHAMESWIWSDCGKLGFAAQAGALSAIWLQPGSRLPQTIVCYGASTLMMLYFLHAILDTFDTHRGDFDTNATKPSVWWIARHMPERVRHATVIRFLTLVEAVVVGPDMSHFMIAYRMRRPYRWLLRSWTQEHNAWWSTTQIAQCKLARLISCKDENDTIWYTCSSGTADGVMHRLLRPGETWHTLSGDDRKTPECVYRSLVDTFSTINEWSSQTTKPILQTSFRSTCMRFIDVMYALCHLVIVCLHWLLHPSSTTETTTTTTVQPGATYYGTNIALDNALASRNGQHVHWLLFDAVTWPGTNAQSAPLHHAFAPDFSPQRPSFQLTHWNIGSERMSTTLQRTMADASRDAHYMTAGDRAIERTQFETAVNWGAIRMWRLDDTLTQRQLPYRHEQFKDAIETR